MTEKFSEAKFLSEAHGEENKVKGAKPVTPDFASLHRECTAHASVPVKGAKYRVLEIFFRKKYLVIKHSSTCNIFVSPIVYIVEA